MNKNRLLKKVIIVAIFVVFAIILYLIMGIDRLERSAILHFDSGKVYVNEKQVLQDVKLKESAIIRTAKDGKATVILYNSIIILLEPDSTITLENLTKKNPIVNQTGGKTWNKFIRAAGVERYTIKFGNSIASVRGTFFGIKENKIIVSEGEVEYAVDEKVFLVTENEVVEETEQGFIERTVSEEEREEIQEALSESIDEMIYLAELVAEEQESTSDKEDENIAEDGSSESVVEEIEAEINETIVEIVNNSKTTLNNGEKGVSSIVEESVLETSITE